MNKTIIIGAGISGLFTGLKLAESGHQVTVLEKEDSVGGMAKSFHEDGFILDFGPHKLYSVLPGVMDEFRKLMDGDLFEIKKRNSIYLEGKHVEFPLNPIRVPFQIKWTSALACGLGFGIASAKSVISHPPIRTYEEYFKQGFGKAGYNLIFRDLGMKVWGDPTMLTEELARKRIPVPNAAGLVGSLVHKQKPTMSAATFLYPKYGCGSICETIADQLQNNDGAVKTNARIVGIDLKGKRVRAVTYQKGSRRVKMTADTFISTMHLKDLLHSIKPSPPTNVLNAAEQLHHRSLVLVFLFFDKEHVMTEHWTFFPEKRYIFNRLSEPSLSSPHVTKPGKTFIIAEITMDDDDPRFEQEQGIVSRVIQDMEHIGLIQAQDVSGHLVKKARRIYPICDVSYGQNLRTVLDWLDDIENLYTFGRPGLFNYNNMDHCVDGAKRLAVHITSGGKKEEWQTIRATFDAYRIVD